MKPHDELQSLLNLFPSDRPLLEQAEHVSSAITPEPYRTMLAHNHHMTVTMESHHKAPVDVQVLERRTVGDHYCRKILLRKLGTDERVLFGIVRFDLKTVSAEVRDDILREQIPLGRILIEHNVLREVELGAILRIIAGPELCDLLHLPPHAKTFGRLATIFCNGQSAVDLLEISSPLTTHDQV